MLIFYTPNVWPHLISYSLATRATLIKNFFLVVSRESGVVSRGDYLLMTIYSLLIERGREAKLYLSSHRFKL